MKINDSVFGELEYEYVWFRYTTINFLGKEVDIALTVDGGEDGNFDEGQYEAYTSLMQNWNQIQQTILQPILDYYKEKRHELGYDVAFNENYPLIVTIEQLLNNISMVGITIPYADCFDGRGIGITFDCTWDVENGVGVRLIDEKVDRVGYQDVVA